jgi:hypothetical protein
MKSKVPKLLGRFSRLHQIGQQAGRRIIGLARRAIRPSVRSASPDSYIRKFGGLAENLLPSAQLTRPLPLNFTLRDQLPKRRDDWGMSFFEIPARITCSAQVYHLKQMQVIAREDNWRNDFYYLFGANGVHIGRVPTRQVALLSRKGKPKSRIETAAWILDIWYRNYFHWNVLHLPKLAALEKIGWKGPVIGPTKHLADMHRYLMDSAHMFGFDQSRFLPPPSDHFEVDKFAYVSIDMMDYRLLSDVRTRIWGNTQPVHVRRLYIRRPDGARRQLHNQPEVETVLYDFDFEFVEPDKLDFAEQVDIFSEASVIIGLHGAGLSNMMYAKPVSDLINFPNPHYYALASELGHSYAHLECRAVPDETRAPNYRDLKVDTENMRRQLDAYLARPHHTTPSCPSGMIS